MKNTKAPLILGVVGGLAGLSVFLRLEASPFEHHPAFSGLDLGIELMNFAVLLSGPSAVMGILGGALSPYRRKTGGVILLAGFGTVSFGWIYVLGEAAAKGFYVDYFFFVASISFLWLSGLILLGALFAFPKTREILRKSWEPWPGASERQSLQSLSVEGQDRIKGKVQALCSTGDGDNMLVFVCERFPACIRYVHLYVSAIEKKRRVEETRATSTKRYKSKPRYTNKAISLLLHAGP